MAKPPAANTKPASERMLRKANTHGRIGEAAVAAKCWMHGIPAYNTGGLRTNFAGSDLIIDTEDPKTKCLVQVKTGCSPLKNQVYLTHPQDLSGDKFVADFVVLVNIDKDAGSAHQHDGRLSFEHLRFYVLPRDAANALYGEAVRRQLAKPLRNGGARRPANMAVSVPADDVARFHDACYLMRKPANGAT